MNQQLITEDLTPRAVVSVEDSVKAREELAAYAKSILKVDSDFGMIPGTNKNTLYQPGADKLLNLYGLTSRVELVEKTEIWEVGKEFFRYIYRCSIVWPRRVGEEIKDTIISQCDGEANSRESKWATRWEVEFKLTPEQKQEAQDRKWKQEKRTAKSGKEYTWYAVPNSEICNQVNTLMKMAQKRAYVGATIKAVKASDLFTQDMEDLAANYQHERGEVIDALAEEVVQPPKAAPAKPQEAAKPAPKPQEDPKPAPTDTKPPEQEKAPQNGPQTATEAKPDAKVTPLPADAKFVEGLIEKVLMPQEGRLWKMGFIFKGDDRIFGTFQKSQGEMANTKGHHMRVAYTETVKDGKTYYNICQGPLAFQFLPEPAEPQDDGWPAYDGK